MRKYFSFIVLFPLLPCLLCSCGEGEKIARAASAGPAPVQCDKIHETARGKHSFYEENSTYADPYDDTPDWIFARPEAEGMNPAKLEAAAAALENDARVSSLLIVRNGAMVFERYFHGSRRSASNNVHSASKSILSAALGIAVDKGLIKNPDEKLFSLLPKFAAELGAPGKKLLTLRHLLTMQGGLEWTEDSTEFEVEKSPSWIRAILNLPQRQMPGSGFAYSTALTHLESAILSEASGLSTCEFVHRNLFSAMNITAEHWGRDPDGYFSGGYNLYLTSRELAKFGLLYLNGGVWKGKRILAGSWVEASLSPQVKARPNFDYGFNWWVHEFGKHRVAYAWGYGGQFVYLVKDLNLLVVLTTNTYEAREAADFARRSPEKDFDGEKILTRFILPAAD